LLFYPEVLLIIRIKFPEQAGAHRENFLFQKGDFLVNGSKKIIFPK